MFFAAPRVVENIVRLIVRRPTPIDTGKLRSLRQNIHSVIVLGDDAGAFQLCTDGIVDLTATGVIGRDDKRVFRLGGVILGDSLDALRVVRYLRDAALLLQ